jgi:hypothetical protein
LPIVRSSLTAHWSAIVGRTKVERASAKGEAYFAFSETFLIGVPLE